jgi:hypothetical protein
MKKDTQCVKALFVYTVCSPARSISFTLSVTSQTPPHFLSDIQSDVWVTVSCTEGALGREALVRLKVESAGTESVCLAAKIG